MQAKSLISLSQLYSILNHYSSSCLPDDRHTVANYFRLQAFLTKQCFPSLPVTCSSDFIFFLFHKIGSYKWARTVELHLGSVDRSFLLSSYVVFSLLARLFQKFDYFPLYSFNWYVVTRDKRFQISWSTLNPNLFISLKVWMFVSSLSYQQQQVSALWYHFT